MWQQSINRVIFKSPFKKLHPSYHIIIVNCWLGGKFSVMITGHFISELSFGLSPKCLVDHKFSRQLPKFVVECFSLCWFRRNLHWMQRNKTDWRLHVHCPWGYSRLKSKSCYSVIEMLTHFNFYWLSEEWHLN